MDVWFEVMREGGDCSIIYFVVLRVLVKVSIVEGRCGGGSGVAGVGGVAGVTVVVSNCALQGVVRKDGVELIIKKNIIIKHREAGR